MNNDARFAALKKKIGGNREITGFEFTTGIPKEQQLHFTPVNKSIRRIVSELEFALKLDAEKNGQFKSDISSALDILKEGLQKDGVLTKTACENAEKMIIPLSTTAKEYKLILCGHAHLDMNWMWGWNETVSAVLSTFRTMLNLMDEYPKFKFSQSQASAYKIVEEYDSELMQKIKKRIKEGRWEVTAGAWVETDKNMPTGESLLNTVSETRKYLEKSWDVEPKSLEIDFSPDTFGHSIHVPEINTHAGLKYYYHCRAYGGEEVLYRYKSPSGSDIIMYREPYWYNSAITPHIGVGIIDLSHKMQGLKTGLVVYGVGDHGGGVTRRDIERAMEMMQWPIFPEIKFGTYKEFFAETEKIREKLPVVEKELNCVYQGCYTSQSHIKRANKMCEASIIEAQELSTFAAIYGKKKYNSGAFSKAWENTLFTHFHDILPGSCMRDSREHALGLLQTAKAYTDTEETLALRSLSDNIDSSMIVYDKGDFCDSQSEGAGVGFGTVDYSGISNPERGTGITRVFNIFNPTASERKDICELRVWDWSGDVSALTVEDAFGNPIDFSLVDTEAIQYWAHKYIRILVIVSLKAFGYTTVAVGQKELEKYPFNYIISNEMAGLRPHRNNLILENNYIKAEFNQQTMSLISFVDKSDGSEKIDSSKFAGLVNITTQSETDAWRIGKYAGISPLDSINNTKYISFGKLRNGFSFDAKTMNSVVNVEVTLDEFSKELKYHIKAEWNETKKETSPLLAVQIPLKYEADKYLCDVPMGVILRNSENQDVPANNYICAINGNGNPLFVSSDSTYGYRGFENTIIASLINTSGYPDPYPEVGMHEFTITVGIGSNNSKTMSDIVSRFVYPLRYVPTNPHKGKLKPEGVLCGISAATSNVTSVSMNERGNIVVRLNEICGESDNVCINIGTDVKEARKVELLENVVEKLYINNANISVAMKPYSIATVEIEPVTE